MLDKIFTERNVPLRRRLWFIAQMPPPVNGQNVFNERMEQSFSSYADLRRLSMGASVLGKVWRAVVNPLQLLIRLQEGDLVYASLPGQMGAWLFIPSALVLRVKRKVFYLHHHSFRAVAIGPLRVISLIEWIGGQYLRHIFLCEGMGNGFATLYTHGRRDHIRILPNAALLSVGHSGATPRREGEVCLGHMSVMTEEKGVLYLLDLWKRLIARGVRGRLILAGPIPDLELRSCVEMAVADHPGKIEWLGPLWGASKQMFFDTIDLFVLPTRLIDEADPLVLIEAYSNGVAMLAPDRGCIRGRMISDDWLLSMNSAKDADLLAQKLDQVMQERATLPAALQAHSKKLFENAHNAAVELFGELGADDAAISEILGSR